MYDIFSYAYKHTFNYKTDKSIYNILSGKKSHQTFFDACSQQLLSLYHSFPKLKYPSFERYIQKYESSHIQLKIHPRYTYDSLISTYSCIQLLVQSITQYINNKLNFVPISQQLRVQQRVKQVYSDIVKHDLINDFQDELCQLFHFIYTKNNNQCYIHYYLQGYDEPMYTRQQVSLIEDMPITDLFTLELNDLVELMYALEQKEQFPILSKLIILPPLLNKTALSHQQLLRGITMDEAAVIQNVKINTIEDHVLELFIKGYLHVYTDYVDENLITDFEKFYIDNRGERLKIYKNQFEQLSYFQIKLIIVGIERGDISVER
ncbi:helix-turn-helix domain-containing protein [Staphylococcus sp. NRL 16/872]|uniref:helix-turn-helix domain-containing protein n=1 Tax=Staphylococcus sp. NRL 16/872 TaxID=2930131 RepID=UPI001FB40418|nr:MULTISPECIES: helix-turn-helix domain-containing protein [unclassified Staphylococcus]MCJ1656328.1 helix-turn-helix domain-containing protein [Staphylococcus sp. NRL 21/187]MCJ1662089.1 helix-turn-helix domain-containing protein [Staphylococcus sp. NRL 18/288]MCJ1668152.1 helix-turn-helix domain-containing protein [Staphylococcus sp. NRL 19/737]WEN68351.1 helix-turn-helix domain-containing protein [Staphylococcus sp. NRL 16/872]